MGGRSGGPWLRDLSRPIASYEKQSERAVEGAAGLTLVRSLQVYATREVFERNYGERDTPWLVSHDYPALEAVFVDAVDRY